MKTWYAGICMASALKDGRMSRTGRENRLYGAREESTDYAFSSERTDLSFPENLIGNPLGSGIQPRFGGWEVLSLCLTYKHTSQTYKHVYWFFSPHTERNGKKIMTRILRTELFHSGWSLKPSEISVGKNEEEHRICPSTWEASQLSSAGLSLLSGVTGPGFGFLFPLSCWLRIENTSI